MYKLAITVIILAAAVAAHAESESCATFGRKLVCLGDNEAVVWDKAGKPDRTANLENSYGAAAGERWFYYLDTRPKKVITIDITDGRVVYISERR